MDKFILFRICSLIIGYLIGNFTAGYFIAKSKNIDIKNEGSGNVGTTNSLRVMGKKAGALTLVIDFLKTVLAIVIVYLLFKNFVGEENIKLYCLYAGVGCIIGHDFPVFLKFKGGKGIACSAAMVLILFPMAFLIGVSVFILAVVITRYVSLGSILGSIGYGVTVVVFACFDLLNYPKEQILEVCIIVIIASILNVFQHRSNIVRLINHNENKLSFKKKQ